ncbi:CopD family protein [Muricoccus aerilatus]|uniref:copper resistance CopC/CopD family protein n=1 Tax=Muricoccus aerilatus TaxID=452982 RepID=UPI000693A76C|nr:CopD family protein [Roseomonas aerilata]
MARAPLLRRARRLLGALLLAAPMLTMAVPEALAHAALVESSPADGEVLPAGPTFLSLLFDEPVTPLALRLLGPAGEVPLRPAPGPAGTLRAALPAGLAEGTYIASYRVVSADGHPVGGALAFGLGTAPAPAPVGASEDAGWTDAAAVLRGIFLAAFAIAAGGALFRIFVEEVAPARRRSMAAIAAAGAAAALAALAVQGGAMAALPFPAGLADPSLLALGAGSALLPRAVATSAGMALLAASLPFTGRLARGVGPLGAVLAAIGLALSGHAAAGGAGMQAMLAAHALAAAYWLGALWPLLAILSERGAGALPAVRRFAALAIPAVALLLLGGTVQALGNLPGWGALFDTGYGGLLLAKLAGTAALLALATLNHFRLTPALPGCGGRPLARSIRAEAAIGLGVLAATAFLGVTPPHAAPHHPAAVPTGIQATAQAAGMAMRLEVTPARPGPNRLTLHIQHPDGRPADPTEVWLELSQPAAGVDGLRRRMRPEAPGRFVLEGPELAVPGHWTARAELLLGDFDQGAATFGVEVGPAP